MKFRQNTRNFAKFRIFSKKNKRHFCFNPNYRPVQTRRCTYGWSRTKKDTKATKFDDLGPYGCDAALVWWRWDNDARAPIVLLQSRPVANSRQCFPRPGSTKKCFSSLWKIRPLKLMPYCQLLICLWLLNNLLYTSYVLKKEILCNTAVKCRYKSAILLPVDLV